MKKIYENPTVSVETVSASDVIATSLSFGGESKVRNVYDFTEKFGQ